MQVLPQTAQAGIAGLPAAGTAPDIALPMIAAASGIAPVRLASGIAPVQKPSRPPAA